MNAVRNDVENLVKKELAAANKDFPLFSSSHEGYAVLLEEIDELKFEVSQIKGLKKKLWKSVKENESITSYIEAIKMCAIFAAVEAIQVAAMCDKFLMFLKTKESNVKKTSG